MFEILEHLPYMHYILMQCSAKVAKTWGQMSRQPWKLGDIFKTSETLAFFLKIHWNAFKCSTWAPQFAQSVISGHDRYNHDTPPACPRHIVAETFPLS